MVLRLSLSTMPVRWVFARNAVKIALVVKWRRRWVLDSIDWVEGVDWIASGPG
jgi:hypothetical protein